MVWIYFSVPTSFYRQGLTLVSRCFQLTGAWFPAAGTPLLQGRPGGGNHLMIGPAAMVAWYDGTNRSHSKGDGPKVGLTQGQPGTPGGSLGGNALSGFWFLLPAQKKPPAGSVPAVRRSIPPTRRCGLSIPRLAPERQGKSRSRRRTSSPHQTRLRWALAGAP